MPNMRTERRMRALYDLGTLDPEEIVRIVAGNFIHTRIYKRQFERAFPELQGKYNLANMRHPYTSLLDLEKGRVVVSDGRRLHIHARPVGFADPATLRPDQKYPHECMGITKLVSEALRLNGIMAYERFYKTRISRRPEIIGHWVIEYDNGTGYSWTSGPTKWVLKDPSVANRKPHKDHFYSWQVFDFAAACDEIFERFRGLYQNGDSKRTKEMKRKADAMKTWCMTLGLY